MITDLIAARCADAAYPGRDHPLPAIVFEYETSEYVNVRYFDSLVGQITVISVRGSDDKVDWIRNADVKYVDYHNGPGKVHEGLQRGYLEICNPVLLHLRHAGRMKSTIVVVAHSRGGPPAAWLADELISRGAEASAITFGSPRSCDYVAAMHITERVNVRNIIAGRWPLFRDLVPPRPLWMLRPGADVVLPGRLGAVRNHIMSNYLRLLD